MLNSLPLGVHRASASGKKAGREGRGCGMAGTQTRARIKRAFTELLGEKGLDSLTVSDLTRRAGVNRGTFYLHFVDKYDLLEKLEGEVISDLAAILLASGAGTSGDAADDDLFPRERLRDALAYVAGDLDFICAIAGRGGDARFADKFRRLIEGLFDQGLARAGARVCGEPTFPAEYARELALSHVMAIITLWLRGGCRETPDQVAAMVSASKEVTPASLVR